MRIDLYGQLYDFFTDTYMLKSVISIYVIMYVCMKVTDLIITEWDRQTAGTLLFTLSFSSILERIQ